MTKSLTSILFRAARLSADGRAARKGPAAVGKRYVRKQVYKQTVGILGALLGGTQMIPVEAKEVTVTVEEFMVADFIIPSHGGSMAPGFAGTAEDAKHIIDRLAK